MYCLRRCRCGAAGMHVVSLGLKLWSCCQMSAFIMSSVAVVGVLASPVAQDVAYADDGGLGDKSGSADIADDAINTTGSKASSFCLTTVAWHL